MRTITAAFLLVLLFLVPAFRAVETLPPQLSDEEFWGIVTDSSEVGGTFLSENFLSNERGFQYVIPPLLQKVQPGGVYMGVGPEQNFTYVSAFHPKMAFIVDIRRQNMIEHLLYKAVFEMSPNRTEFLSHLFSRKALTLGADPTVEELFSAYASVPLDAEYHQKNLQAVKDLLWNQHKFGLTAEDEASLEHVYDAFSKAGTSLGYTVSDPNLAGRVLTTRILDLSTGTSDITVLGPADQLNELRTFRIPVNPAEPQEIVSRARINVSVFPTYNDLMTSTDGSGVNWSYLASEANYKVVREMQQKNLIVPLVGDFAGPKAIQAVGKYLGGHNATVSVFYLSNVEQYLTPTPTLKRFYDNVATLPLNSSSSFIRSAQATGVQPGIVQSYSSPMRDVVDAVMDGSVQGFTDLLRLSH